MKPLIVWGGTGQLIVLDEFINELGYEIKAIVDNNTTIISPIENVQICYKESGLKKIIDEYGEHPLWYVVAIGGKEGEIRCEISKSLTNYGLIPISAIHPKSYLSKTSTIGIGCQIMMRASVGARAQIGNYVLLNTGCIIDHECCLGNGVHIGPGATIAGLVNIGHFSFIGAGAVVLPRIQIGENSIIGAGSIVTKDVPDNVICFGNPAKIYKKGNLNGSN